MCVQCAWARLHEARLDKMDRLQGVDSGFAQRLCRVVHLILSCLPDDLGDHGHKGACSERRVQMALTIASKPVSLNHSRRNVCSPVVLLKPCSDSALSLIHI